MSFYAKGFIVGVVLLIIGIVYEVGGVPANFASVPNLRIPMPTGKAIWRGIEDRTAEEVVRNFLHARQVNCNVAFSYMTGSVGNGLKNLDRWLLDCDSIPFRAPKIDSIEVTWNTKSSGDVVVRGEFHSWGVNQYPAINLALVKLWRQDKETIYIQQCWPEQVCKRR